MPQYTPLYDWHKNHHAQIVDFAGWEMPIHYGSQMEEHHAVRKNAGIFDVSHMGILDILGKDAKKFLRFALANDIQKLQHEGDALYTCMLNEKGGVIDDLIVYYLQDPFYRLIINASRREKDYEWLKNLSQNFDVTLHLRTDLGLFALQGPDAIKTTETIFPKNIFDKISALKPFQSLLFEDLLIARTGYTGEDGLEIILPKEKIVTLWQQFIDQGVKPCGLGARDTLRLEAGLNLYGADMDENTSPLISNLAWTVSFKDEARNFVGRDALLSEKNRGISQELVGLVMEEPGVLRNHQRVKIDGNGEGSITSGTFSPTLGFAIALARIPRIINGALSVERRGAWIPVKVVKPPFVRKGKKVFED